MTRTQINLHLSNNDFGRKGFTIAIRPVAARYEACAVVWNVLRKTNPTRAAALKAEAVAIWEGTR